MNTMSRNKVTVTENGMVRQNPYKGGIDHKKVKSECWDLNRKDINWVEVCEKVFAVKQKSKEPLLAKSKLSKEEIAYIKDAKMPEGDFPKNEMKIMKACLKRWGFKIQSYKKGRSYGFSVPLAEFFFFLLTYDRQQKGFISKLKTGKQVTEAEEASFFLPFYRYYSKKYSKNRAEIQKDFQDIQFQRILTFLEGF